MNAKILWKMSLVIEHRRLTSSWRFNCFSRHVNISTFYRLTNDLMVPFLYLIDAIIDFRPLISYHVFIRPTKSLDIAINSHNIHFILLHGEMRRRRRHVRFVLFSSTCALCNVFITTTIKRYSTAYQNFSFVLVAAKTLERRISCEALNADYKIVLRADEV